MLNSFKDTQLLTVDQIQGLTQGLRFRALNRSLTEGALTQGIQGQLAQRLSSILANGGQPIGLLNAASRIFEANHRSTQLLLEIANSLSKAPDTFIQQNILNQTQNNTNILTVHKAMELLDSQANSPQILEQESQEALISRHQLRGLPDIRAKNTDEGIVGNSAMMIKVHEAILREEEWEKAQEVK